MTAREGEPQGSPTFVGHVDRLDPGQTVLFHAPGVEPFPLFLQSETEKLRHLLLTKREMYGRENILITGMAGIGVRLQDKVSRLRNLADTPKVVEYESLIDTLIDIAGYALIGLALHENVW